MPSYSDDNWPALSVTLEIGPEDGGRTSTRFSIRGLSGFATVGHADRDVTDIEVLGESERRALARILAKIAEDLNN